MQWRAPVAERSQFVTECLRIARHRKRMTFAQFALLVNDLKNADSEKHALRYAREFGFTDAELERAMQPKARAYTADERAAIFEMTYAERMQLHLRRTGSIDLNQAGRERARRDRYNAKRRVARHAARIVKANVASITSISKEAAKGSRSLGG